MTRLIALLALVLAPLRYASAATMEGTLITNIASASMNSSAGAPAFTVSYSSTATVLVRNPCINLVKNSNPTTQTAGGTVTFTLYVVNCSCWVSAHNVIITDRLPDNVNYSDNYGSWNGGGAGIWTPYSCSDNATWVNSQPVVGQGAPYYLRFVLDWLGPCKSAMAQFTANIL